MDDLEVGTLTAPPVSDERQPAIEAATPAHYSARRTLDVVIARSAIVFRCGFSSIVPVVALAEGMPTKPDRVWWLLAVLVVVAWGALVFKVCRKQQRLPVWLVLIDVGVAAALLLNVHLLVPPALVGDGATWAFAYASPTVLLASWGLRAWQSVVATIGMCLAYLGGLALADRPALTSVAVFTFVVYPIQCIVGLLILRHMRGRSALADAALHRQEQTQRQLAVETAVLDHAEAHRLTLHDTVLSLLTAVARGGFVGRANLIRRRAARDLSDLEAVQVPEYVGALGSVAEVVAAARADAEVRGIFLTCRYRTDRPLPSSVAETLRAALREGLSNIERHAGVDRADMEITGTDTEVIIQLHDAGSGFTALGVRDRSLGLRGSIQRRLAAIGGQAEIVSSPNEGTTLTLRWQSPPDAPAGVRRDDAFGQLLTGAYATGLARALTWVAFSWHAISFIWLVSNLGNYRSATASLGAWGVLLAVAVWLVRKRPEERVQAHLGLTVLAITLSPAVVAVLMCQGQELLGKANWAVGDVGWFLVALSTHWRGRQIVPAWFVVPLAALGGTYSAFAGAWIPLGHMVSILLIVTYMPLGALAMYRILEHQGRLAAAALQAAHELETEQTARRTIEADRAARYRGLDSTLWPLVRGLADGHLDPDDPSVQTEAWVAAGTLRALLEHDHHGASAATLETVVAIASAAGRQGVVPELRIEDVTALPPEVVTALTQVITVTLGHARPEEATVVLRGTADGATASVCLSTAVPAELLRQTVTAAVARAGVVRAIPLSAERVWLEATWAR